MPSLRDIKRRFRAPPPKRAARARRFTGLRMPSPAWTALSELADARDLFALSLLEGSGRAPEGVDLDRPWWALACTSAPIFLSPQDRARCEALMGWAPPGAADPDWEAITERAIELFTQAARRAGSGAQLHLRETPQETGDAQTPIPRARHFMPAYGYGDDLEEFFDSLDPLSPSNGANASDPRRAKRRRSKPIPSEWKASLGSWAAPLWHGGVHPQNAADALGAPLGRWNPRAKACFDTWGASVAAIAQAMLDCGASSVERVAGFFAQHPEAVGNASAIEALDRQRLDPLRQRWDIEASAGAGSPSRPRGGL